MFDPQIQFIMMTVAFKDYYTYNHCQRVAQIAEQIAYKQDLPKCEVKKIQVAALLHDIGKIGIPDLILKKPDKLNQTEWEVMKNHPAIGAEILAQLPELAELAPIVKDHHARWDGQGYPSYHHNQEISLPARIIAIADAFEAMTSDRPYREGLQHDVALQEIEKGAGSQFDPDLAVSFVRDFRNDMSQEE